MSQWGEVIRVLDLGHPGSNRHSAMKLNSDIGEGLY